MYFCRRKSWSSMILRASGRGQFRILSWTILPWWLRAGTSTPRVGQSAARVAVGGVSQPQPLAAEAPATNVATGLGSATKRSRLLAIGPRLSG
jgi:hypothetical protein